MTKDELKALFGTGKLITEANFGTLIDMLSDDSKAEDWREVKSVDEFNQLNGTSFDATEKLVFTKDLDLIITLGDLFVKENNVTTEHDNVSGKNRFSAGNEFTELNVVSERLLAGNALQNILTLFDHVKDLVKATTC
jgi:hypothetical protein